MIRELLHPIAETNPMKIIRRIVILVVLLLIVGGIVIYMSLDRIIKTTVQTEATSSLNLNTTLDSAHLALLGGSLKLDGLTVASPPGFGSAPMFQLGQAAMKVNYGQLRDEPIHVSDITITNPSLLVEYLNNQLNLNAAMDQMPKSSDESSTASSGSSKPIKLIIDNLTITGATVTVHPGNTFPGMPAELAIPLPPLTLKNIGTGNGNQNGAALNDVIAQVTTEMWASALKSGKIEGQFKQMALAKVQDLTKNLPGNVGGTLSDLAGNPSNAVNDILGKHGGNAPTSQPANKIGNDIGNFLNGGKK
jgi:hypothetical protein